MLLYPGEYENSTLDKSHIQIIKRENKAIIRRCCSSQEQREKCDGTRWLKPLDCWSYPFFPSIENDTLVLLVDDVRCPVAKNCDLHDHYFHTFNLWQKDIENKDVFESIKSLSMKDLELFLKTIKIIEQSEWLPKIINNIYY